MPNEPRRPRWRQPTAERDAAPRPIGRAPTGPVQREPDLYDDLREVTPPPVDVRQITAQAAWDHANNVAKRTADALTSIAHSSGVGMEFGDEVRDLRAGVSSVKRKMKWWQALAIAALTASGSALFGLAKGLYSTGEKNGVLEMRLRGCEQQAERNRDAIDRIQDTLMRSSRRYSIPTTPENNQ